MDDLPGIDPAHGHLRNKSFKISDLSYQSGSSKGIKGNFHFTKLFPQETDLTIFNISDLVLNMNLGYSFGDKIPGRGKNWISDLTRGLYAGIYYQHRSGVTYPATKNGMFSHFARTPSVNMFNININKDFRIGKGARINFYVIVENLFNFKNVYDVYSNTGSPDDDGYLSDPAMQHEINSQISPDSYRLLYQLGLYSPDFYGIPQIWRFGLTFKY